MSLKDNILRITTQRPSGWLAKAGARQKDAELRKDRMEVCLIVLEELSYRNMSQVQLAKLLEVSPQQVSKLLKGDENFTFDTIHKLQNALGIQIMTIKKSLPAGATSTALASLQTQVDSVSWNELNISEAAKKHFQHCVQFNVTSDSRTLLKHMANSLSSLS